MKESDSRVYEVLSKVTKSDFTSLISIVCCVDGVCCVIPKKDIVKYNYSNVVVGVDGKLRSKRGVGGPITDKMLNGVEVIGMSRRDFVRFLTSLGRSRGLS